MIYYTRALIMRYFYTYEYLRKSRRDDYYFNVIKIS